MSVAILQNALPEFSANLCKYVQLVQLFSENTPSISRTISSHLTASGAACCSMQEPYWVRPKICLTHYLMSDQ